MVWFLILSSMVVLIWNLGTFNMAKPVIYIYPTKPMNVDVRLVTAGVLTASNPLYDGGWQVYAEPNGRLDGRYDYLFYEADVSRSPNIENGWVVKGDEIGPWLDDNLPRFGLNEKEKGDFMDYWMSHLPPSKYYYISLISDSDLDKMVGLDVNPRPDTVIRVDLYIKPLKGPVKVKEPIVNARGRQGFTVVEWGVIWDG